MTQAPQEGYNQSFHRSLSLGKSNGNNHNLNQTQGNGHSKDLMEISKSPPSKNLAHVPCKFFKQGACQAGSSCPFSHTQDSNLETAPCKYFAKGNCKFGLKCALAHILPDGRRVNPKSLAQVYQSQQAQAQAQVQAQSQGQGPNQGQGQGIISPQSNEFTPGNSIPITNGFNNNSYNQFVTSQSIPSNSLNNIISPTYQTSTNFPQQSSSVHQTSNANFTTTTSPFEQSPVTYHTRAYSSTSPFTNSIWSQQSQSTTPQIGEVKYRSFSHSQIGTSTRPLFTETINESAIMDDDDEDVDQSQDIDVFEEDFVPSSLSDLLTPQELKRRGSRPSSSNVRPQLSKINDGGGHANGNSNGNGEEDEMQFKLEEDWLHS